MDKQLAEALAQMDITRHPSTSGATSQTNHQQRNGFQQSGSTAAAGSGDIAGACGGAVGGVGVARDDDGVFSKIFPMLQGYMDGQSALACRAVCKDWKQGVDVALSGGSNPDPNKN